jgi:hypothetical protein
MFAPQKLYTPLDAMQDVGNAQNALASGQLKSMQAEQIGRDFQDEQNFNALMDQAGGDYNRALEIADDWRTRQKIGSMKAQVDEAQVDDALKKLELGSKALSQVYDDTSFQAAKGVMQKAGMDVSGMPESYDPDFVQNAQMQAMDITDRLKMEREERRLEQGDRRLDMQDRRMEAMLARQSGGDTPKAPAGYRFSADGTRLEPIAGGPADQKAQQQQLKIDQKAQKEAAMLDSDLATMGQTKTLLNSLKTHKGKKAAVGASSVLNVAAIPGSDRTDFLTKLEQLKGQQFLQAFESLKGGGAITEVEGKKAEQAIANLSTAQSEEQFDAALQDFYDVVDAAETRAKGRRSGVTGSAAPMQDSEMPRMSAQDQQALQWAMDNPQDPRADAIRRRLGQ